MGRAFFRNALSLLGGIPLLAACRDVVYVPADGFTYSLTVTTDPGPSVSVGQQLTFHATRSSGPWQAVPRTLGEKLPCSFPKRPPEREAEVAANLDWQVTPEGSLRMDGPTSSTIRNLTRTGRFSRAGTYTIVGESRVYCPRSFQSAPITVVVKD